jgi:hypothetical protein
MNDNRQRREPAPPIPTLEQLRAHCCWTWGYCNGCGHGVPMAWTPLIIRWGPDESSNRLRREARCARCGHRGATLIHPSWMGTIIGMAPFPTDRSDG